LIREKTEGHIFPKVRIQRSTKVNEMPASSNRYVPGDVCIKGACEVMLQQGLFNARWVK